MKQPHYSSVEKRWLLSNADDDIATRLQSELNISLSACRLLAGRGIRTYEDARKFFRPALNDLYDPFLMKDMDKAVERIGSAIAKKERILVYGDYDVDGTTSVALMYCFIKEFYQN